MLNYLIASQIVYSLLGLLFWLGILLLIRRKAIKNVDGKYQGNPVGLWVRFVILGFDFNLIYLVSAFFCYWGSYRSSNLLLMLLFAGYFFFGWLFFVATLGGRLAGVEIISAKGAARQKILRVALRCLIGMLAAVGWVTIFLNKDKRMLHDFAGGTKVIYSKEFSGRIENKKVKIFLLLMLGATMVLFASVLVSGLGKRIANYAESAQVKLYDTDNDSLPNMIAIDGNKDGKFETFKFDANRDGIIESAGWDLNGDEIVDAHDVNNDGRVDAYDFNGDGQTDVTVKSGIAWIWVGRIWFWLWDAFVVWMFGLAIFYDYKNN